MIVKIAIALLINASVALAYIPHSRTIVGRAAKNAGKGAFTIEQDVSFRVNGETITVRETWTATEGEALRLNVTSNAGAAAGTRYDVIYSGGKKHGPDLKGGLKSSSIPPEFFEAYQHARSGNSYLAQIVRAGIVPSTFVKDRPRYAEKMQHVPEDMVRLGREMGAVNYVFGTPSPADGSKLNPSIWIEQDSFLLRKVRYPSGSTMSAEKYVGDPGSLRMPTDRTITWGENTATIRLISVKSIPAEQAAAPVTLTSLNTPEVKAARLPDVPAIKEFYGRFR